MIYADDIMEITTQIIRILLNILLFFNENQFINLMSSKNGLSILDLNVCNAFTKYDKLSLFVNSSINHPVSVICLNECWLSVQSDVSSFHLPNYDMYYQVGNCFHCGLITYVHISFKSNEININYDATGWEHLTIEISYNSPNAKKIWCRIFTDLQKNMSHN